MFTIGDRIGNYEIIARLKDGGMATLFLARRVGAAGFARHVALKVVHPHLATDKNFVNMFVDEALLSARIEHPNVVHVEELGQHKGTYFLVMEYVRGCSLGQFGRALGKARRRLSPAAAVAIAARVAEGLHAAHETVGDNDELLGVVHRDVNPQNILLSYRGHVKLIDFGIAKARGRSQHTSAGLLKGKLRYMAPEQAYGKEIDRRADIYALGIVLWELLAMRKLFTADNDLALLDIVRTPHVRPPSEYSSKVSPLLDAAVLAALSPNPDARPATALEFRKNILEAMPAAASLDASDLVSLIQSVMASTIEEEKRTLPTTVSRVVSGESMLPPPILGDAALRSFTENGPIVANVDHHFGDDTEEPVAPPSVSSIAAHPQLASTTPQPIEVTRDFTQRLRGLIPVRRSVAAGGGVGLLGLLALIFTLAHHRTEPVSAVARAVPLAPSVVAQPAPIAIVPLPVIAQAIAPAVVPSVRTAATRSAHPPARARFVPARRHTRGGLVNGVPIVEEGGF